MTEYRPQDRKMQGPDELFGLGRDRTDDLLRDSYQQTLEHFAEMQSMALDKRPALRQSDDQGMGYIRATIYRPRR